MFVPVAVFLFLFWIFANEDGENVERKIFYPYDVPQMPSCPEYLTRVRVMIGRFEVHLHSIWQQYVCVYACTSWDQISLLYIAEAVLFWGDYPPSVSSSLSISFSTIDTRYTTYKVQ